MKKTLSNVLFLLVSATLSLHSQTSTGYGLPAEIQDGNILHCFCWPIKSVTENLEAIAEAGYGAVQLSPMQRKNVTSATVWYDPYRPYDYSFQETSGLGSADDLKELCSKAANYGIKVIVDVVANHVDKTSSYHDPWWDSNTAYVRSKGGSPNINYGNRNSITHDRLGDYYELNTENVDVIARAKAYVQQLHDMGVSGIRWDAAKHIELPSEGSRFWAEVTSVPGMFHYGEILGSPGPDNSIIDEYAGYISVTDSEYSDASAKNNGGIPTKAQGNWASRTGVGASKVILWGESHDTYSNTPDGGGWSTNIPQAVIDRAYASIACRQGSAALYFSRPATSGFNNIKIAKGTDAYKSKAIKEINKFRNKMGAKAEAVSFSSDNQAVSITRDVAGAVIVMKTSGTVSVPNGNSYLLPGEYIDRVSGMNTFTVTSTTIEGEVGPSGIAVLYNDANEPIVPDDTDYPVLMTIYYDNTTTNWDNVYCYYWGGSESGTWPGTKMNHEGQEIYSISIPESSNVVFNNGGNGKQTKNIEPAEDQHVYKGASTDKETECSDEGLFQGVEPDPDIYTIYYDDSKTNWGKVKCHMWGGSTQTSWPGTLMDPVENETSIFKISLPKGSSVVFNNDSAKQTEDVNNVKHLHIYQGQSATASKTAWLDNGIYTETSAIGSIVDGETTYTIGSRNHTIVIESLDAMNVTVAGIDGRLYFHNQATGTLTVHVSTGIYIVNVDGRSVKIAVM